MFISTLYSQSNVFPKTKRFWEGWCKYSQYTETGTFWFFECCESEFSEKTTPTSANLLIHGLINIS